MKKWFLGLSLLQKVLVILAAIILIYIAYRVFSGIISGIIRKQKAKANYNATVNQSQDALNQLAEQGVKPSFAQAQYSGWADSLQNGFNGCGSGWASVAKPIFSALKNDADVFALIQNYGIREIEECGWGSFNGDLNATVAYKFSGWSFCNCIPLWSCNCENCGCVDEINKILKSNSIVFQF